MVGSARAAAIVGIATLLSAFGVAARTPTALDLLTLSELGDYRGGLAVSPDGAYVAVFERRANLSEDRYDNRLLVMPSAGGPPRVIGDGGDVILRQTTYGFTGAFTDRPPSWSPNGRALAYLAMHQDRVELWRVALNGAAPERLAGAEADVLRFAWLDDDQIIVELAPARATLEATVSRAERLGFHPDVNFTPYASLQVARTSAVPASQVLIDVRTQQSRAATDHERALLDARPRAPISIDAVARDQTPEALAWIAPRTPGDTASAPRLGLYRANGDGSDVRMCVADECSGRMLGAWTIGAEVIFRRMVGHGDGLTALYAWNWSRNTVRVIRQADEELFGCGRARDRLVCLQESALQPRQVVSINVVTGALSALYDPNPQWRAFDLTRVELIEVVDAYGNESFAHLVFPTNYVRGRRYPVVIVQYRSRGFLRGGVGGEYPIHPLAARGYFVLSVDRPEWRGAEAQAPYRELFLRTELDGSENHMKQSALEAMLAELDRRGLSDTRRIGITGLSDGAETVYWAITRSDLFAAAVVSTPPTDATAWTLGAESFRRSMIEEGFEGPWPEMPGPWAAWWSTNATALHAEAIETPLLMNLPESEAMMGFPLATRLSELGRPFDLYVYPEAYHVKWRPQQILSAQNRAMDSRGYTTHSPGANSSTPVSPVRRPR